MRTVRVRSKPRRATVLVMVVGVLAMLFIIGSSLLISARFERQTADLKAEARSIKAVAVSLSEPLLVQLREDLVGDDGTAYNRSWNNAEKSFVETYGETIGFLTASQGNPADLAVRQARARNGDLLLSSLEPWFNTSGGARLYATSWGFNAIPPTTAGTDWRDYPRINFAIDLTRGFRDLVGGDADGDGLRDSPDSGMLAALGAMFDGGYRLDIRVVPHGGMVLLNQFTHPALLAQVIHPSDSPFADNPLLLWADGLQVHLSTDEAALRRRFMLPRREARTESTSLDKKLPFTLGFSAPAGAPALIDQVTPHWWPVNDTIPELEDHENAWWPARLLAGPARTEQGYNPSTDTYDRRHLVTVNSSDDLLRPIRDESRLSAAGFQYNSGSASIYQVLNPNSTTPNDDAYGLQRYSNGTVLSSGSGPVFNVPGLRTQFSLRDVLVDPATSGYQASYTRAVQLMAYYLALIQHTTVPGSDDATPADFTEQLRTAAQLAVNTIDFADNADNNGDGRVDATDTFGDPISYFEWPQGSPLVKVYGVEKQPFITEVYTKICAKYEFDGVNGNWTDGGSIFAVELYNPYMTAIDLTGYKFDTVTDPSGKDLGTVKAALTPGDSTIGAGRRLVFANRNLDSTETNAPFDATSGPNIVVIAGMKFGDPIAGTPSTAPIELRRERTTAIRNIIHLSNPTTLDPPDTQIVVDRLDPSKNGIVNLGDLAGGWHWDELPDPAALPADGGLGQAPTDGTTYWRHTSVQRHKEPNWDQTTVTPIFWHFSLARQKAFQTAIAYTGMPGTPEEPAHNLLGFGLARANAPYVAHSDKYWMGDATTPPVAPFPVLVADRGIDPLTKGCIAFPTTGTLLLVSRYGHGQRLNDSATVDEQMPLTVSATLPVHVNAIGNLARDAEEQIRQLDNGHLPVFDYGQVTKDNEQAQGRFGIPWGQLAFEYFTALPIEELYRPLTVNDIGLNGAMVQYATQGGYEGAYGYLFGNWLPTGRQQGSCSLGGLPLVDRASGAPSEVGPTVRGRINVNFAPWWVLDGLPVLPDATLGTTATIPASSTGPLAGLPVPELLSGRLDPDNDLLNGTLLADDEKPGAIFVKELVETGVNNLPSVSPTMARAIVGYRELRTLDTVLHSVPDAPGLVTTGALLDVLDRIKVAAKVPTVGTTQENVLRNMRLHVENNFRPFAYLGYLQAVAPIVRLQDWTTVKNHVFTVYTISATTSQPPIALRSQVTVDRTRCLYTTDLPARITEQEPIGYYNAADD